MRKTCAGRGLHDARSGSSAAQNDDGRKRARSSSRRTARCVSWRNLEDESRRSRGGRNGRGSRGRNEDVARLFINIGKNQGIRPGDILGAIAGESGMPGRMVGSIDMFDNYTFVEVPREHADVVLQAMRGAKDQGQERAYGEGEPEVGETDSNNHV